MPLQKCKKGKAVKQKKVVRPRKTAKCNRNSYSVEQKKLVVAYAKENEIITAAKSFELDKGMVSRWVKSNEKWINEPNQRSKRVGSG